MVEPERGVVDAGLQLRKLDGVKRVLLIGAHPDDEDTSLIAALARKWGAEVAYLSLSRGEGGQNLIGPEFDEGLGIIRTGELLAARELDGGGQFFTRAFDFGYSKTAEETFGYWPRDEVLADVVWVVRSFRPQVVVSIFDGTSRSGHGQHQVAGITAYEAFDVAGDPGRFPEQLTGPDAVEPWTPSKLYRSARFDPDEASSRIEVGDFDPLLGRSHFQLAMQSRSQHRSQDMGVPEPMGPRTTSVTLVESRVDAPAGDPGIFAGVDTALAGVADGLDADHGERVRGHVEAYREALRSAEARLSATRPSDAVPSLVEAAGHLDAALSAVGGGPDAAEARRVLTRRAGQLREGLLAAAGVVVDVRADDDQVVPGETLNVQVAVWNGGPFRIRNATSVLDLPDGWRAEAVGPARTENGGFRARFFGQDPETVVEGPADVAPGTLRRWRYRVRVPADAEPSRLYYLEESRDGQMYRWPEDRSLWGLPRNPPVASGAVEMTVDAGEGGSAELRTRRPARYVGVEPAGGQYTEPLLVAPALSVGLEPRVMAWPVDRRGARTVSVALRNQAEAGRSGTLRLEAPEGWTVEPSSVSFELGEPGEGRSVSFSVRPGEAASEGAHRLRAVAETSDGRTYREGFDLVDYPHIPPAFLFEPSRARVSMFPVAVDEGLRVGYIMGSGDDGAEALRQLGVQVDLLGPARVRDGDFSAYDVVVTGVRAYETRPDLVAANGQLLEWVRDGGTLLVQYNKYPFSGAGYAPYPVRISRPHDRVTDEDAEVTLLDPDSPVFTRPNRITDADFRGWAQERGLYFLGEWDDRYTPLMEMSDPGEEPKRGSLLVAPVGEGLWIYTGLAFFRQWPEGVPGAYRLFANLVSLDVGEWKAHHGAGSP